MFKERSSIVIISSEEIEVVEVAEVVQPVVSTTSSVTPTTIPDATAKSQVYATLMSNANSATQMTVYGTPVPTTSYFFTHIYFEKTQGPK